MLSIVLVSFNERERLRHVLDLLSKEFSTTEAEVIVVDNNSHDGSADEVKNWPKTQVIRSDANLMYGKGNNLGFERATGDWLLILNCDVDWQPGNLKAFVAEAKAKNPLGLSAPQLCYPDGRIQVNAHRRFPNTWTVFIDYCLPLQQLLMRLPLHPYQFSVAAHHASHLMAHATGACLLVPRAVYKSIGGFDPVFTMYLEETDWQKRMADQDIPRHFFALGHITHFGSAKKTFAQASRHYLWGLRRYVKKHWTGIDRDPRLISVLWTATIISDIVLLLFWPLSWLIPGGGRIRHYARVYAKLTAQLTRFPTTTP